MSAPAYEFFATSTNHCLPMYCVPVPDPLDQATHAMLQDWSNLDMYAFSLFNLVSEVIDKFQSHSNSQMTLAGPFLTAEEWFMNFPSRLVDFPRLLPQ